MKKNGKQNENGIRHETHKILDIKLSLIHSFAIAQFPTEPPATDKEIWEGLVHCNTMQHNDMPYLHNSNKCSALCAVAESLYTINYIALNLLGRMRFGAIANIWWWSGCNNWLQQWHKRDNNSEDRNNIQWDYECSIECLAAFQLPAERKDEER